jgi:hypothetical protein
VIPKVVQDEVPFEHHIERLALFRDSGRPQIAAMTVMTGEQQHWNQEGQCVRFARDHR